MKLELAVTLVNSVAFASKPLDYNTRQVVAVGSLTAANAFIIEEVTSAPSGFTVAGIEVVKRIDEDQLVG